MRSVCVFCGSNPGSDPVYLAAAKDVGTRLAMDGLVLVYGGARVGLMGAVADAALAAGGRVSGVIPKALVDKELAHDGLSELHTVSSMHERKALMADLADAFIALPGGAGTLEELFEVWTWGQLGFHDKPVGLLNVKGFYDGLLGFLDHQSQEGFVKPALRDMLVVEERAGPLLDRFRHYAAPRVGKWVERGDL
ncbi:MAG: TIGR00730 family Rossman fold protein [Hyphomicrobiaceae bacterium]|nr:TIGR00730 family Rossman fold protein [Hyphomicrobiaceae bacterium]